MATKTFSPNWNISLNGDSTTYSTASYYYVGGSADVHAYIGFPNTVNDALRSSTTTPTLKFQMEVYDAGQFDIGVHKHWSAPTSIGWYAWTGISPSYSNGVRTFTIPSSYRDGFISTTTDYDGIVMYQTTGEWQKAYRGVIIVEGSWGAINIKVGGSWKSGNAWIRVGGAWKEAKSVWIKVGGTWKQSK